MSHGSVLAVIPARGGSKGLPRKNIRELGGKPLIAYTIEAAQTAACVDRIIVSTDEEEIARVARQYGAEVPFLRPAELAEDTTPTFPVLRHALEYLGQKQQFFPEAIAVLQPTSPLRTARHVREAMELFWRTGADTVTSVYEVKGAYWLWRIEQGRLVPLFGMEYQSRPRQLLPKVYQENGAIYVLKREIVLSRDSLYGEDVRPYLMGPQESLDIENEVDLKIAEVLLPERTHHDEGLHWG